MSLLLCLSEPLLTETEFNVSKLSVESLKVSVPTSDYQTNVALERHMGNIKLDSLVFTILVVLSETNSLSLLVAVTEVNVGPDSFDILMSHCLHDVGVVGNEVIGGEHVLVDVQEHGQCSIAKLFGIAVVFVLHQSGNQVVLLH